MTTNLMQYLRYACVAFIAGAVITGGPDTTLVRSASADLAVLEDLTSDFSIGGLLLLEDPECPKNIPKPGKGQTCESIAKAHCTQNSNCKGKTITCDTKGGKVKHCKCKSDGSGLENDPCPTAGTSTTIDVVAHGDLQFSRD
ncbi:MAG: hypothetical protein L6R00_21145 [Phycisphaerae bacterium]|nr:hypothetical protein [Phycisphaerae bacterium]